MKESLELFKEYFSYKVPIGVVVLVVVILWIYLATTRHVRKMLKETSESFKTNNTTLLETIKDQNKRIRELESNQDLNSLTRESDRRNEDE